MEGNIGGAMRAMTEIVPYWFEYDRETFCSFLKGDVLAGKRLNPTDRIAPPPKGAFVSGAAKGISGVAAVPPDILDMTVIELTKVFESQPDQRFDVGRASDCPIVLNHPTVSPRHANLHNEGQNNRWITDLRSDCGTFVNNQPLPPHIKTNLNMNDTVGFGAYKLFLRTYPWVYHSLATRLRRPREDEPFVRLVVRYLDGRLEKRVARAYEFSGERLFVRNFLTNRDETFGITNLKAVYFVKHLIGNPGRADKQGFVTGTCGGENMFVEFLDGECMWGNVDSYNPNALGFYIKPADDEGNNLLVYVDRRATKYILNG